MVVPPQIAVSVVAVIRLCRERLSPLLLKVEIEHWDDDDVDGVHTELEEEPEMSDEEGWRL